MKISFDKLFDLLHDSAGVAVDDGIFEVIFNYEMPPKNSEPTIKIGDWEFLPADNQEVELVGSSVFLKNSEGEEFQIALLKNWDAESEIIQSEAHEKALRVYFPIKE